MCILYFYIIVLLCDIKMNSYIIVVYANINNYVVTNHYDLLAL